jgi:hypothetical protein
MVRRFLLFTVLICLVAPLAAQAPGGWRMRVDRSTSAEDPDDRPDLHVVARGKGFQVTGGPAGTFWNPTHTVSGDYTVKATFALLKPSDHTNYYGIVFGGSALDGANQGYSYFLIAQNGTYIVRSRAGESVSNVRERTPHAAIRQPDASGRSTNTLEVRVAGNTVSYVVNGTVVHTTPKSGATARTDGIAGVRVNHALDVLVENFEVQKP